QGGYRRFGSCNPRAVAWLSFNALAAQLLFAGGAPRRPTFTRPIPGPRPSGHRRRASMFKIVPDDFVGAKVGKNLPTQNPVPGLLGLSLSSPLRAIVDERRCAK